MYLETGETVLPLKKTSSTTISLSLFFFGILYFIYCCKKTYLVVSTPFIFNILDFAEWPIYIFIFINAIIKSKYKVRYLMLIFCAGCIFLLGFASTGYAELLKALMIIVALKNFDYHKLFDVMYRILTFSIMFTVVLYLLGISDAGVQRRGASSLGYSQANAVGYVLMALTLLIIVRKDKVSSWNKVILALLNLGGFILACVALLFSSSRIYMFIKRYRLIQNILAVLPVILMIATILTAILYQSNVFVQWLDVVFSARISMNSYILANKGVALFGQTVEYHGLLTEAIYNPVKQTWSNYMTIDNAYMSLIIEFGGVATIVVGMAYFKLMKKLFDFGAINIALVMSIISLYGIAESSIISIYVAFPFLLLLNDRLKNTETRAEYDP